ncbi:cytochrome P450 [Emericellopsis atlantica]|uniref:Cytochrome P450 n=1 Tax=Emericellopsis atlantica TaxID=2614577 RepID=A0A9P8CJU8_9HYPO|nr:cytochrome P450 [Emericellopsis atlantica]KAG9249372.1 cytochrome P450 [Emericellopsis atlantica]
MSSLIDAIPWGALITWSSLAVGLTATLITTIVRRRYLSAISNIPGPFWASLTRLWHVWIILEGRQNERLVALHKRYGPFVRIAPNEISVCHRDASTLLLRANLHKGDWYHVTAVPDFRFRNPMSTTDPRKKKALSKHFAPGYAPSKVRGWESDINGNIECLLSWIDAYAEDEKPMHLDKFITYTTFDNIGSVFFSEPFGFIKAGRDVGGTLRNNVALSKFAAAAGFFLVPLRILVNPLTSWMLLLPMGRLYRTTSVALRKRMSSPNAGKDMLSHWLRASEVSGTLSAREIEAQANVNVGAGAEPVSTAIQSVVYHMIRHPKAWSTARDEIDAARAQGRCQHRVVSSHDAQSLPYVQACVKESLRLFSPTTMGLPRKVPKGGITIAGRHFAEGTTLSVSSQ